MFFLCEFDKRLCNAVGGNLLYFIALFLFVPVVIYGCEQIVIYDGVAIFVAKCEFRIGCRTAFIRFPIEFIAAVVLTLFLLGCEEDVIIIDFRAQYVVPFLNEQYACLGAGMRFEGVAVQSHDGKNAASFGNIFADGLVAAVVESALR